MLGDVHGLKPITSVKANIYHLKSGDNIMRVLTKEETSNVAGGLFGIVFRIAVVAFHVAVFIARRRK